MSSTLLLLRHDITAAHRWVDDRLTILSYNLPLSEEVLTEIEERYEDVQSIIAEAHSYLLNHINHDPVLQLTLFKLNKSWRVLCHFLNIGNDQDSTKSVADNDSSSAHTSDVGYTARFEDADPQPRSRRFVPHLTPLYRAVIKAKVRYHKRSVGSSTYSSLSNSYAESSYSQSPAVSPSQSSHTESRHSSRSTTSRTTTSRTTKSQQAALVPSDSESEFEPFPWVDVSDDELDLSDWDLPVGLPSSKGGTIAPNPSGLHIEAPTVITRHPSRPAFSPLATSSIADDTDAAHTGQCDSFTQLPYNSKLGTRPHSAARSSAISANNEHDANSVKYSENENKLDCYEHPKHSPNILVKIPNRVLVMNCEIPLVAAKVSQSIYQQAPVIEHIAVKLCKADVAIETTWTYGTQIEIAHLNNKEVKCMDSESQSLTDVLSQSVEGTASTILSHDINESAAEIGDTAYVTGLEQGRAERIAADVIAKEIVGEQLTRLEEKGTAPIDMRDHDCHQEQFKSGDGSQLELSTQSSGLMYNSTTTGIDIKIQDQAGKTSESNAYQNEAPSVPSALLLPKITSDSLLDTSVLTKTSRSDKRSDANRKLLADFNLDSDLTGDYIGSPVGNEPQHSTKKPNHGAQTKTQMDGGVQVTKQQQELGIMVLDGQPQTFSKCVAHQDCTPIARSAEGINRQLQSATSQLPPVTYSVHAKESPIDMLDESVAADAVILEGYEGLDKEAGVTKTDREDLGEQELIESLLSSRLHSVTITTQTKYEPIEAKLNLEEVHEDIPGFMEKKRLDDQPLLTSLQLPSVKPMPIEQRFIDMKGCLTKADVEEGEDDIDEKRADDLEEQEVVDFMKPKERFNARENAKSVDGSAKEAPAKQLQHSLSQSLPAPMSARAEHRCVDEKDGFAEGDKQKAKEGVDHVEVIEEVVVHPEEVKHPVDHLEKVIERVARQKEVAQNPAYQEGAEESVDLLDSDKEMVDQANVKERVSHLEKTESVVFLAKANEKVTYLEKVEQMLVHLEKVEQGVVQLQEAKERVADSEAEKGISHLTERAKVLRHNLLYMKDEVLGVKSGLEVADEVDADDVQLTNELRDFMKEEKVAHTEAVKSMGIAGSPTQRELLSPSSQQHPVAKSAHRDEELAETQDGGWNDEDAIEVYYDAVNGFENGVDTENEEVKRRKMSEEDEFIDQVAVIEKRVGVSTLHDFVQPQQSPLKQREDIGEISTANSPRAQRRWLPSRSALIAVLLSLLLLLLAGLLLLPQGCSDHWSGCCLPCGIFGLRKRYTRVPPH